MTNIGDNERKTQDRVMQFFQDRLCYTSLGNRKAFENSNIMQDTLYAWLIRQGHSEKAAGIAVDMLVREAANLQQGLYHANKEVYSLLKYGAKVREAAEQPPRTVYFMDFTDVSQNDFYIAEEVTVAADNTKRPDMVVYVNGIALAVIELKSSRISVSEGIRQNLTNQQAHFIDKFFTTIQFCMAGNDSEGLRYGTLLTSEKNYLEWKADGFQERREERDAIDIQVEELCRSIPEKLDGQIFSMFYKRRFLDFIHNFVIFDKGVKKVCRYNQYYAIKRARRRLGDKKQGGIIWHTQGSGKSLTMVWLSKWILENNPNSRVVIVTDREELDEQIEKIYKGVDEKIVRTKSGKDLLKQLDTVEQRLMCSLVHKFGRRGSDSSESDYEKYIKDLKASLPDNFCARGELVVFVDECHRTQSGKLHEAMKAILPKALFIGFTGTPLLKRDKKTSLETFGGYIHTYKFNEGVQDGVILDLRYEARDIPQSITSQNRIDVWFEAKTTGLAPRAKARLKSYWGNIQKVFSSRSRLEQVANDIIFDFATKDRLMDGSGNAILVAEKVYSACRYYEIFQSKGFRKCAVISSYVPRPGDMRTETVSDEEDTESQEKYNAYLKMIGIDPSVDKSQVEKRVAEFEEEAKRKFVEEPANMKLLIVVDKLLTGFDAPGCTYLYIDRKMHDHGLFQAICRVNRLHGESKEFGYIVDYKELFGDLTDAMNKYTRGAFEAYEKEDIEGLIKDRTTAARTHFAHILEELEELCEGVEAPKAQLDYIHYFCGESGRDVRQDEAYARIREKLYKLVGKLVRGFAELKPRMGEAGYSPEQQGRIEARVTFYIQLRETIGRASGDFIDLKAYEPGMRYLIDNYILAGEAQKVGSMEEFTLLDFILAQEGRLGNEGDKGEQESAAETIENNIRKKIVERMLINPAYYEKMSAILERLILDRRQSVIAYARLLETYTALAKNVVTPERNEQYPKSICASGPLRAFYDNCGRDEELAIRLHRVIVKARQEGFRNNQVKENRIKRAIYDIFHDDDEVERIYRIVVEQEDY